MKPLLSQLNEAITDNGEIDYTAVKGAPSGCYFIDWPSSEEPIEDQKEANRCLYAYVYGHLIETLEAIGEDVSSLKEIHSKILSHVGKAPKKKQLAAFQHLVFSNQESYEKLTEGKPEEGYSTFMSYYIASAIFKCDSEASLLGLKKYYSSMIDRGATTFFEDFSIDWLEGSSRIDELPKEGEKDLHGDYGSFCYKGFRHSLCHGWSAGPVQFLFEKIAGIETLDSDHIVISPSLCWLNKIDLTYPTKHGPLKVSIKKTNGKPIIEYEAPRGLNVSIN